ncbi:MAG: S8 family serine peptidase [Anaerolineales bacterium]
MLKANRQHKAIWSAAIVLVLLMTIVSNTRVVQAQSSSPNFPLLTPEKAEAVPDQYIVVYKPGFIAANAESSIRAAVAAQGGEVKFMYKAALNGYSAHLPPAALAAVRANPNVEYVESDVKIQLPSEKVNAPGATQTGVTWGLDRIDQHDMPLSISYDYDKTGAGVHVYVIDTGIRSTHVDFGGRASKDYDSVGDGQNGNDCNGHGTHVAGTIGGTTYGVAKGVQLHAVRVLDCYGEGTYSGVIAGLDWVTANHLSPAVANMSLGGPASAAVDTATRNMISSGVVLAVAAGNSSDNACNYSPARVPIAITVGATDSTDARSYYSNWGTCLDIFAPGSYVTSDWNTSDYDANTLSGTSMASPHVAGVAALYLEDHPSATISEVRNEIVGTATRNHVTSSGVGSINRLLYSLLGPIPLISDPITPNNITADTTPTYTWSELAGATQYSYELWQSGVLVYTKTVASDVCINKICSDTPTDILAYSPYQWRVQAFVDSVWQIFSGYMPFAVVQPGPAFNSQFNSNATGWSKIKGGWNIVSQKYYRAFGLSSYLSATAAHTGTYFTLDYRVSIKRTGCSWCADRLYVRGKTYPLNPSSYYDWNSGYIFQYVNDGYISVWSVVDGSYAPLLMWKPSSSIHRNGWNTLRVTANGSALKFYINSTLVWSGVDSILSGGAVGVGMFGYNSSDKLYVDWAALTPTVASVNPADEQVEPGKEMPGWNNPNMAVAP